MIFKKPKELECSRTDPLTGTVSRKFFESLDRAQIYVTTNKQSAMSVVLIDIVKFEMCNNTYGYETGDEVLKYIAMVATNNIEKKDMIVRYGESQFLLLLYHCDYKMASEIMSNISIQLKYAMELSFAINLVFGIQEIKNQDMGEAIRRAEKDIIERLT